MQLRLKWVNPNIIPTEVSIYRSDAIVDVSTLTTPLVTLPGTTDTWLDPSVVRDATYYYYWKVTTSDDTVWSAPFKVIVVPYSGPGPQEIIYGTYDLGYCGVLTWQELFNATDLVAATGVPINVAAADPLVFWVKMVRNGKYLFIPRTALGTTTFTNLYNRGCVFGVSGPGPWQPSAAKVDQLNIVEKGIHRFIVRLPTGADDRNNPTRTVASNATVAIRRYSEAADVIYPIYSTVTNSQRMPALSNTIIPSILNTLIPAQESYNNLALSALNYVGGTGGNGATVENLTTASFTTVYSWFPILELIPTQTLEVTL